ncbi:STAS domain-containing protein [Bremerella sp. T1]|uniref:STAS domain-containing protein n=1 Tax=Bremerella sp. TYQ1 TaxID=3119568 RepID=UPI001CCCABF6|nr:STAS domain-containing protein [Bremerella volcania]UBM34600.1 STAS domain-containing protein [Bremerella volcania]
MKANTEKTLVSYQQIDDVCVITPQVTNMRDANVCLAIREQLLEYARTHRLERVLVDLNQVRFMSSLGVRVLVTLLREVCEVQGRIMLCSLHGELRGVLFVCSLITDDESQPGPFEVAANREDALGRLRSP